MRFCVLLRVALIAWLDRNIVVGASTCSTASGNSDFVPLVIRYLGYLVTEKGNIEHLK